MAINDLTAAVLVLIRHYVARQELVDQFLRAVRPDFYVVIDDTTDLDALSKLTRRHGKYPQVGIWGEHTEWKHFIHGRGCRLTHSVTGEPVEWDTPDVRVFDMNWLANYLDWVASRDAMDDRFETVIPAYQNSGQRAVQFLQPELEALKVANYLDQPDLRAWNHWRLLK